MCVHLASMLGVDFLFQDVDVMWFKNPLDFFQDKDNGLADFDALFQDDGSRSVRFGPYCANSGESAYEAFSCSTAILYSISIVGSMVSFSA